MKPALSNLRIIFVIIILSLVASCKNEKIISLRSLLVEMTDREAITRFPDPSYRLIQQSSYDRRSISADSSGWFANNDYTHFIREEEKDGEKEYVMFEAEGPGAVIRWWMTFGNEDALGSYIRIYIDGDSVPLLEGMAPALVGGGVLAPSPLSAAVSPLTAPQRQGYNLYLPIPFKRNCKITLANNSVVIDSLRRTPSIYYSVSARIYDKGARVISMTKDMLIADSLAMAECTALLSGNKVPGERTGIKRSSSGRFPPGDECTIRIVNRNRAIESIDLKLYAPDTANALHGTRIRIAFDGKQTVDVPAGNFFGTGYSVNPYRTLFSSTDTAGRMVFSRLMPFRDSCTVTFLNGGRDTVSIEAVVTTTPYKWDRQSMYFGAFWHEYRDLETAGSENTGGTGKHVDLTFVGIEGRGVYAGDAVTVINSANAWWGEGDEKIYVDREIFPSSIGTGTEDYYGYAWCRPEPFSHPFISQPTGKGNFFPGMTVNMRYRVLDAIPFENHIRADIELWHWVRTKIDYGMTSFYYVYPGFTADLPPTVMPAQTQ
jgi:hypothetical protein